MNKLLVICGPTATGKTALAAKLAKKFNGELVSADSRQVYRGMDIITGKDRPPGAKIHLLDEVEPNEEFSVSHYYRLAWKAIKKIWKENKLPILVGGTGLYIKAVVDGIETKNIPPNLKIRQLMGSWEAKKLFEYLQKLDPGKAANLNRSDRNNPRRLIRAIEIACWKEENPDWQVEKQPLFSSLFIGFKTSYLKLYERIDKRVSERIKQGALEEIEVLLKKGYHWEDSILGSTIGYREWRDYFEGKITKERAIKKWQFAEHTYARRQLTWFKKDKRINWFDVSRKDQLSAMEKLVKKWYDNQQDATKD